MTKSSRTAAITMQGCAVSVCFHIAALAILASVRLQPPADDPHSSTPAQARIAELRRLVQSQPVMPKPRLRPTPQKSAQQPSKELTNQQSILPSVKARNPAPPQTRTGKLPTIRSSGLLAQTVQPKRQSPRRRVCFVVDCSGSMQGIFSEVLARLKKSIAQLQPDEYFYVIFFGEQQLRENGEGLLQRASPRTKQRACQFIDSIQPAGKTNALAAIERAMRIRGPLNEAPNEILLFTDGFELGDENGPGLLQAVRQIREKYAPNAAVNVVGFWVRPADAGVLQALAGQNGGRLTLTGQSKISHGGGG